MKIDDCLFMKSLNELTKPTQMNEDCIICYDTFDNYCQQPVLLCKSYHIACKVCTTIIFNSKNSSRCPQCQMVIIQRPIFSLYIQCEQLLKDFNNQKNQQLLDMEKNFEDEFLDILSFETDQQVEQCSCFHSLAMQLMRQGKYSLAASVLMATIQKHFCFADSEEFLGLGSINEAFCYQLQGCEEYWHHFGEHLSLLDELSICFNLEYCQEKGRNWYIKITKQYPLNFKLFFCWGILQQNIYHIQDAIICFNKAGKLSNFPKISLMKAFYYLQTHSKVAFRQIGLIAIKQNKQNCASELIRQQLQPFSGLDNKYDQMRLFLDKYPTYINFLTWLGHYHMFKQNYQTAIEIYKKCVKRCPYNRLFNFKIGECWLFLGEYTKALDYLDYENWEKNDSVKQILISALVAEKRAICFFHMNMHYHACYWFDQKAKIFFDGLIKERSVLMFFKSLRATRNYIRIIELFSQYFDVLAKRKIFGKAYRLFNISCFRIQLFQLAEEVATIKCEEMNSCRFYQELGQAYEEFKLPQDALKYYSLAAEEEERRLVCLRKCAETLERLQRYKEAADILEECCQKANSEREQTELQEKIQYLRNRQS